MIPLLIIGGGAALMWAIKRAPTRNQYPDRVRVIKSRHWE